mmetsp:Transcript_54222/g.118827  ORF Transcript_54222/g.118827 Transcript_54222/m.118827 type:complete len:226 (+) Transcript_54222:195-872(+)
MALGNLHGSVTQPVDSVCVGTLINQIPRHFGMSFSCCKVKRSLPVRVQRIEVSAQLDEVAHIQRCATVRSDVNRPLACSIDWVHLCPPRHCECNEFDVVTFCTHVQDVVVLVDTNVHRHPMTNHATHTAKIGLSHSRCPLRRVCPYFVVFFFLCQRDQFVARPTASEMAVAMHRVRCQIGRWDRLAAVATYVTIGFFYREHLRLVRFSSATRKSTGDHSVHDQGR